MIIFLYGEDTYRLQQKLNEIQQQYEKIHKHALNLEKFDAKTLNFKDFLDALRQLSMFVEKKLFFLENVFFDAVFKEKFLKNINEISKSQNVIVLFEKKNIKKTDKLLQAVLKTSKVQSFENLTIPELTNWVKKEFSKYQANIEPFALNRLIGFVGYDLWQMSQEIKKLSSYTKQITEKEVALFVKPKIETEIFKTIEAIAEKNKAKALRLLQGHFSKGDNPFYVLTMITYQFRNLLLVKSGKKGGMHPFVFRKTRAISQRFSFEELKDIFNKIFQTDKNIKTGKILPIPALKMLITTI